MLIQAADFLRSDSNLAVPHKGIVVDNNDPKKLGRIRATIPGIFEDTDNTKLPWIYPLNPTGLGGGTTSSGFAVPEVNSEVVVEFPYKDVLMPFYTGYWQSTTTHQTLYDTNYPNRYGFTDSDGTHWYVDKTTHDYKFEHKAGTTVTVNPSGDHKITAGDSSAEIKKNGDVTIIAGTTKITMTHSGNVVVDAAGNDVTVNAANIKFESTTLTQSKTKTNLNHDRGTSGTDAIVTKQCLCSFTGMPHPFGITEATAGGSPA